MTWLVFAATTVVLFASWSFLGKVAVRTATPYQATIAFGIACVVVGVLANVVRGDGSFHVLVTSSWAAWGSAAAGAMGLVTFYLALERGPASSVIPIMGVYPALAVVLSVLILGERLTVVQAVGVALALTGAALVGSGR